MFFTTAGVLAGPVLGLLDFHVESEVVKRLAEVTLTLVLFADAARISLRALRHEYAVPLRLLGIGLPLTILAGAVVGIVVVPGVTFAEALVLAAASPRSSSRSSSSTRPTSRTCGPSCSRSRSRSPSPFTPTASPPAR